MKRKKSEYGIQLAERQKVKFIYEILEKQFHDYYEKAPLFCKTGDNLLITVERRLTTVVIRHGFAHTPPVPALAIVGYTNAGKSTLLNHLTDAEVLEEDKLFATLDPTTRMLELEGHQQVLLTDTVGFIRKLPHHLIEAFKSTLEEAKYADYIIHVVDASNPQRDKQMYIVYETLDHLGVKNKKILTLFNKIDIRTDDDPLQDFRADHVLQISATENAGLDAVKDVLQEMLREDKIYIERVIPYAQAGVLQLVRNKGELVSEEYVPEGISIRAYVPMEVYGKL